MKYATVNDDDGVNYRDIAKAMTIIGFEMNHSSARNYVLRVMRKFVSELSAANNLCMTKEQAEALARSPKFQSVVSEILTKLHLLKEI